MKAQTAMEFLITHLWALLIIAIVLGAMIWLGIFSRATPKAPPGECTVYRPDGPGTIYSVTLQGVCDGQLPEFVFGSKGIGDFEIINSSVKPNNPLNTNNDLTITAWVYLYGAPYHDVAVKEAQYGMKLNLNNAPHACSPSNNAGLCLEWDTATSWNGSSFPIPGGGLNKWEFISVSIKDGKYKSWYANGQLIGNQIIGMQQPEATGGCAQYATAVPLVIAGDGGVIKGASWGGCFPGYGYDEWFNGIVTNVQIYNAALTENEINQLYGEGIGGAPADLRNIIGWWPLNGNGNDYSGEGNQANTYNGYYSGGTWYVNYTNP